jgi:hypothetical protein
MGNSFELGNDKLQDVDVKTVKILGSNYLKDTAHVYFKSTLIKNADATSFELLCSDKGSFAKDKNKVYFESHSFKDMDIASFQFAGGTCGATVKDSTHVYSTYAVPSFSTGNLLIAPMENVHAKDYHFFSDTYGTCHELVYYKGKAIIGSDAASFTLVKDYYAKDKHTVYYDGLLVKGLDPTSFQFIEGGGYTKDKNGIYYGLNATEDNEGHPLYYTAKVIVGADPETFHMIKGEKFDYAKDKTRYYWGGVAQ